MAVKSKTLYKIIPECYIYIRYNTNTNFISIQTVIRKRNRKKEKIRFQKIKHNLEKLKINGCAICGYNKYIEICEFHHIMPKDKKFYITSTTAGRKDIFNEMQKCMLLCPTCHAEIHLKEKRKRKNRR